MDGLFSALVGLMHINEFCLLVLTLVGFSIFTLVTFAIFAVGDWYRGNLQCPQGAEALRVHNLIRLYLSVASVVALLVIGSDMTESGARSFESAIIAGTSLMVLFITVPKPLTTVYHKLIALADKQSAQSTLSSAVVLVFPEGRKELQRAA